MGEPQVFENAIAPKALSAWNEWDRGEMKGRKSIRFLEFYRGNRLIIFLSCNHMISFKKIEEGLKGQGHHWSWAHRAELTLSCTSGKCLVTAGVLNSKERVPDL